MKDFSKYWKAITFCFEKHGNQKRKSNIPYAVHPIRVAAILRSVGLTEDSYESLLISALLHDLVEDTNTTIKEISNLFGTKIASTVNELTLPKKRDKAEWLKMFKNASKEAKIIKMADRIDNLLDMNIEFWPIEKQKDYANQGKIILENCGHAHVKLANELKDLIEKKISLL